MALKSSKPRVGEVIFRVKGGKPRLFEHKVDLHAYGDSYIPLRPSRAAKNPFYFMVNLGMGKGGIKKPELMLATIKVGARDRKRPASGLGNFLVLGKRRKVLGILGDAVPKAAGLEIPERHLLVYYPPGELPKEVDGYIDKILEGGFRLPASELRSRTKISLSVKPAENPFKGTLVVESQEGRQRVGIPVYNTHDEVLEGGKRLPMLPQGMHVHLSSTQGPQEPKIVITNESDKPFAVVRGDGTSVSFHGRGYLREYHTGEGNKRIPFDKIPGMSINMHPLDYEKGHLLLADMGSTTGQYTPGEKLGGAEGWDKGLVKFKFERPSTGETGMTNPVYLETPTGKTPAGHGGEGGATAAYRLQRLEALRKKIGKSHE